MDETDRYIGRDDPGEAERLAAQAPGGLDELRGALALCTLPARPRVLEVGCGAGAFTQTLLQALPEARITAVDLNERLLAEARRHLGAAAGAAGHAGHVRFERADAAALPYPARSFDLVACRCVLMHQLDPTVAAAEMHRVVDLGGSALAIEPDWSARTLYPDPEALLELLELGARGHAYGFPDLRMGGKLFAVLRAAGFVPVQVRVTAFVETADDLRPRLPVPSATTGNDGQAGSPPACPSGGGGETDGPHRLLEQGRRLLRTAGLVTDAELDALIARLVASRRSQDYCSAGLDLAAVGHKPAPMLSA